LDTDQDGMPDAWEIANGLDPNNAEDRNNVNATGYTMIEVYLNELAEPAFPDGTYSAEDKKIAEASKPARTYKLVLEKDGKTVEYPVINGGNQIMVPLAPVAEYLGYKMINVAEDTVTMQYPFELYGLNCEGNNDVITFSAGNVKFNETLCTYNGMLYMPINYVSFGMVGVYDQTVTDKANNTATITIKDAEFYKDWHNAEGRQKRKASAPTMMVEFTKDNVKFTFDKEAAFADTSATISITKNNTSSTVIQSVYGSVYSADTFTANVNKANIWGSHKVATIDYSEFINVDGKKLQLDETASYTVKVDANAFADYYNSYYGTNYVTDEAKFTVSSISVTSNNSAAGTNEYGNENEENSNSSSSEVVSVQEAMKIIYKLLAMKEVNASNYDQINDGTFINPDEPEKPDEPEEPEETEDSEEEEILTILDKTTVKEAIEALGTGSEDLSKEIEIFIQNVLEVLKEAVNELVEQEKDLKVSTGEISLILNNELLKSIETELGIEISINNLSSGEIDSIKENIKKDSSIKELVNSKKLGIDVDGKEINLENKEPIAVTVKVSNKIGDTDKLTAIRYEVQQDGSIKAVKIGGTYDSKTNSFTYYTDKTGIIAIVKAEDVKQVKLTIGNQTMYLNGKEVVSDVAPIAENNRTYLPIRVIAESLSAEVGWEQETQSVIVTLGNKVLKFNVNKEIEGYGKPLVKNERTLVPVRYISEQLGANVLWIPSINEIEIVR